MKRRGWARLWRWGLRGVIVLAGGLVAVYLALVYRPGAYDPRPLSEAQALEAEQLGYKLSQDLYNNSFLPEPFTITLVERRVNDLLLLGNEDPLVRRLSKQDRWALGKPQVSFADDHVYIMALVERAGVESILTVALAPVTTDDGQLQVQLESIKVGAVPVPAGVLRRKLAQRAGRRAPQAGDDDQDANVEDELLTYLSATVWPSVDEWVQPREGAGPLRFRVASDGRWLRVTDVDVGDGRMAIEFTPEND